MSSSFEVDVEELAVFGPDRRGRGCEKIGGREKGVGESTRRNGEALK